MVFLEQLYHTFNQSAKFLSNVKIPGSKYWLKTMLNIIFDIKYYKNIRIHVICTQVLAHFVIPSPYFDRFFIITTLSCFFFFFFFFLFCFLLFFFYQLFFLKTISNHCLQYVFVFSIRVLILSNRNQLHIATYLENEWGPLKLAPL